MKIVEVVAGIIFDADAQKVLIALRKPDQHQGNLWEFPGGKMESGESQQEALQRELLEEINLRPIQSQHRVTVEHRYSDKHVRLHFWNVTTFSGDASGREGQELRWVPISELSQLAFPQANQSVVDALIHSR